jgi:ABC-type polysaccharide/polyol phosphate transport system ATPase subunit
MAEAAVELHGVGKRYRLGEHHGAGMDLRETLVRLAGRLRGRPRPATREFWSLRDVTFDVAEGQSLGIIGRNGAGKSTLLRVVSNITTPTEGRCRTRGRVGSLLEVGTGFHGELTGLENTFLNGAILGMSRREVAARLDEIVAFAGLEQFMDTPVKRYSSGMYLRLGFAIAAHMEAEILVVDEVLAVGDAEFQRRCLGKMREVEQSGRTVLFVSHDLDAMSRLCPTAIWLDRGRIRDAGETSHVIDTYARESAGEATVFRSAPDPDAPAQIVGVSVVDDDGHPLTATNSWTQVWVQLDVVVNDTVPGLDGCAMISTRTGVMLLNETLGDNGQDGRFEPGHHRWRYPVPPILTPGEYIAGAWLGTAYDDFQFLEHVVELSIEGEDNRLPRRVLKVAPRWELTRVGEPEEPVP